MSNSIEQIGDSAFENTALESVTFGEKLKRIGKSSFKNCTKLNVIELNTKLELIGDDAFNGDCLTSVIISSNIKKLGKNCFANNPYLNIVTLQNEELDEMEVTEAFGEGTNIIDVTTSSKYIVSFNDFDIENLEIVEGNVVGANLFQGKTSLKSLSLCDTITRIGNNSFKNCANLTTLSCNVGVLGYIDCLNIESLLITSGEKIPNGTFSSASKLKTLKLCDSISEIEENCFNGGYIENLTCGIGLISYFNQAGIVSLNITSGESIGNNQFLYMTNLKTLSIADCVSKIEDGAFSYCTQLEYTEDENGKYIGNWLVKVTNKDVEDLSTKSNLMVMDKALDGCNKLKKLCIDRLYDKLDVLFNNNISPVLEELTIISGVLKNEALKDIATLKTITLQSTTEIGDSVFWGCENLENVNINSNIEKIGKNVFELCSNIAFEEYGNGKYLANVFISVKDLDCTVVEVRKGTQFIYDNAFQNCGNLKQVYIPSTVTTVGDEIFYGCDDSLRIYIQDSNCKVLNKSNAKWNYNSNENELVVFAGVDCDNGYMIHFNGKTCSIVGYLVEQSILYIPQEINNAIVTEIEPYAFYGRKDIETVIIGDDITIIGSYAFMLCENINYIILSNNLKYINQYAFYGCGKIDSLDLNYAIVEIKPYAFGECYGLNRVFVNGVKLFAEKSGESIDLSEFDETLLAQCLYDYCSYTFVNKGDGEIVK